MNYLAYGGGTNSTALAIECVKRGIPLDLIGFADTGGERPETYAFVHLFSQWLTDHGAPEVTWVKKAGEPLEEDCLRRGALPSIAYGNKRAGCTDRWKQRPQAALLDADPRAQAIWARNEKVTKLVGFDADEPGRGRPFEDAKTRNWYPLIEWGMGREECIETIRTAGLPLPGKSSCFFCPNMRLPEIRELYELNPDLFERALAMEAANKTDVRGLDYGKAWTDYARYFRDQAEMPFIIRPTKRQCGGCYDGTSEVTD